MHDEMKKPDMIDICQIERDFINALRSVTAQGILSEGVDGKELGELVDMVKDMAETKRNCWEAYYYMLVSKAMEEYGDDEESMGYNHNHYASGRFAPSGRGHYVSGFTMPKPNQHEEWMNRMGNMGYSPSVDRREFGDMTGSYGYPYYGKNAYMEYEDARRHYTETKSMNDKRRMDEKALEHVDESIATMREIWKTADPELRKEMKESLTSLVSEMPI